MFKEYITDFPNLKFYESEKQNGNDDVTELSAGEAIFININNSNWKYSLGCRARILQSNGTYIYGFLTAGHGGVSIGNQVYSQASSNSAYYLGRVVKAACSGKVDAAFVQLENTTAFSCSNKINNSGYSLTSGYSVTPMEGYTVYKSGATTGLTEGRIIESSVTVTSSSQPITDACHASYYSDGGDSGGLVYEIVDGAKMVTGFHKRHDSLTDSYFCKYNNVRELFGTFAY